MWYYLPQLLLYMLTVTLFLTLAQDIQFSHELQFEEVVWLLFWKLDYRHVSTSRVKYVCLWPSCPQLSGWMNRRCCSGNNSNQFVWILVARLPSNSRQNSVEDRYSTLSSSTVVECQSDNVKATERIPPSAPNYSCHVVLLQCAYASFRRLLESPFLTVWLIVYTRNLPLFTLIWQKTQWRIPRVERVRLQAFETRLLASPTAGSFPDKRDHQVQHSSCLLFDSGEIYKTIAIVLCWKQRSNKDGSLTVNTEPGIFAGPRMCHSWYVGQQEGFQYPWWPFGVSSGMSYHN